MTVNKRNPRGAGIGDLRAGKKRARGRRQEKLLRALEACSDIRAACEAAGGSRRTLVRWRMDSPEFRKAFEAIDQEMVLHAEDRLRGLVDSPNERVALRAAMFIVERRDRGRWGPRDLPQAGATAEEIAQAMHDFAAAVDASVPGPPEAEEAE